jgi:hypothetical protein
MEQATQNLAENKFLYGSLKELQERHLGLSRLVLRPDVEQKTQAPKE